VEIYSPLIYRFCRRRGAQDADARDLTQEVFLSVRRSITRFTFDSTRGKFRSWLGAITTRTIKRYQRKSDRAGRADEAVTRGTDHVAETDAVWVVEFNKHVCDVAIKRIQPDFEDLTWRAFLLLWKQDMKPAEVARVVQKPADWVYQVKYRVLKRLETEIRLITTDSPSFFKD
jgi:RNA polymerase sigma-70 factor, ECF subfamily